MGIQFEERSWLIHMIPRLLEAFTFDDIQCDGIYSKVVPGSAALNKWKQIRVKQK